jgi:hypothetical protein
MWTPWTRDRRIDRKPGFRRSRRSRPALEAMEGRQLLSMMSFDVSVYGDNGNNAAPLSGSLREAILEADNVGPGNTAGIVFPDEAATRSTVIQLVSPLPTITVPTLIDGSLQADDGDAPGAYAQIDGVFSPGAIGLNFAPSASGSRVFNLTVTDFNGGGIQVNGASNVTLDHDRIGVTVGAFGSGWLTTPYGNGTFGVELVGSSSDTLNDDVISANTYNGVVIMGGSSRDIVENSMIGTDFTGSTTYYSPTGLGNGIAGGGGSGVVINTGSTLNSLINNVISGNSSDGVLITGQGTNNNTLLYNEVGTDITGEHVLSNGTGVAITAGASGNVLETNVISGNSGDGVVLSDPGTSFNTIEGNYVGTDWAGEVGLGNYVDGVRIWNGASNNVIGGTAPGTRNVISANYQDGVELDYAGTSGNTILGNEIGTDSSGTHALGNSRAGVYLWDGASGNVIGGTAPGSRNVISANGRYGVIIDSGSNSNTVEGDDIGTDSTGTHALGNGTGVVIQSGSSYNTLEYDVISGNAGNGVYITGTGTTGNWLYVDEIGTDASGTISLANDGQGVFLYNTSGNYVWFCTVAYNEGYGILTIGAGNNSFTLGDTFYGNGSGSMASF